MLKTDANKGKLHNITCMDEYSNKSPEELRWEEYCNLLRYSEPLKPSLELHQKFEEKSSIFVAGGRTSSFVNKDDNQAAAINGTHRVMFLKTNFWLFWGYQKWHFRCPNQNSKTTFQYKYPP